jgi:hypothetical protein
MIDFAARVEDVDGILRSRYGVDDKIAVEIILAAWMEAQKLPYPWLVIETRHYSRDLDSVDSTPWFLFGFGSRWPLAGSPETLSACASIPYFRTLRARKVDEIFDRELSVRQRPLLWIEPEYDTPPPMKRYGQESWEQLNQATVRLRMLHPLLNRQLPSERLELNQAARQAMDPRFRPAEPEQKPLPGSLLYWLELLHKISGRQRSWEDLVRNFSGLIGRLHWLDPEIDWRKHCARVIRDSVPYWTAEIIRVLHQPDVFEKISRNVMHRTPAYTRLRVIRTELRRLQSTGMLKRAQGSFYWALSEPHRQNILQMVSADGEIFIP